MTAPVWSVDLGQPGAGITPNGQGRLIVSTKDSLSALGPDGAQLWRVVTTPAVGAVVPLPGDRFTRIEGDHVVWRLLATGEVLGGVPVAGARSLRADPWGGLVFTQPDGDRLMLRRIGPDGAPVWTVPAPVPTGRFLMPPTVLANRLVFDHDDAVFVVEADGAVWPVPLPPDSTLWLGPRATGPTTVLVGLRWAQTANRLFLIDTNNGTVHPYAGTTTTTYPVTVIPGLGADFRVALPAPSRELRPQDWDYGVILLDAAGRPLWEHRTTAPPASLSAGTGGAVIVAATPDRQRWDEYSPWQDLTAEVFVACLGPDGTPRWSWTPPAWLSQLPVVGPDGMVFVVSQGTVWALAP